MGFFRKNTEDEKPKREKKKSTPKKKNPTEVTITIPWKNWEKIEKMLDSTEENPYYIIGFIKAEIERFKEKQ
jgi:hypothetical protein